MKKRASLKDFIDENDTLLTAMGVMGALAALFTTVKNGQYLAFLSFAMLLVLDVELVRSFYVNKGWGGWGETLIVFEFLLEGFILGIGVFIFTTYPSHLPFLVGPVASVTSVWLLLKAKRRLNRRPKQN